MHLNGCDSAWAALYFLMLQFWRCMLLLQIKYDSSAASMTPIHYGIGLHYSEIGDCMAVLRTLMILFAPFSINKRGMRCQSFKQVLRRQRPQSKVEVAEVNLSSLASVRAFCKVRAWIDLFISRVGVL